MICYCDNYCKDTKADRTSKQYLDQRICFSVIRMPFDGQLLLYGWHQIITVKQ